MSNAPGQPTGTDGMEASLLITFLGAAVNKDAGAPGFFGTIAIGVRDAAGEVWWRATFAERGTAEVLDYFPRGVDAGIVMSPAQALGLLEGTFGELPPEALFGDRDLLKKFLSRYLTKQSGVSLRSKLAKEAGMGKSNAN